MTEGIRKAPNRLTKPRSGGGVGKGSHSPIQALVEAPVGCVQIPDERVGFVQGVGGGVSCVQKAGGVGDVSPAGRASTYMRQRDACDTGRVDRRVKRHLCPPHPTVALWGGSPQFFPTILWTL